MGETVVFFRTAVAVAAVLAMDADQKRDADEEKIPDPSSLTGEAGRQARKQARDCMSGRYRP